MLYSDWPSLSMNPGATTLPAASIVRLRGEAERLPMAATLPSRMPRSPEYQGEPVPSIMWPLVMTRSKGSDDCASDERVAPRSKNGGEQVEQFGILHCFLISRTVTKYSDWILNQRRPTLCESPQGNPYSESDPFEECEMAGNPRHDFHQQHHACYQQAHRGNQPFDHGEFYLCGQFSGASQRKIGGATSGPADCAGNC